MVRPEYLMAGAALAAALAMGTAQAAHASQSAADSPAYEAAINELRVMHQSCAAMGGTMVYDDGHLVEVTFTDDGIADYVLIAEKAYCDGAAICSAAPAAALSRPLPATRAAWSLALTPCIIQRPKRQRLPTPAAAVAKER